MAWAYSPNFFLSEGEKAQEAEESARKKKAEEA